MWAARSARWAWGEGACTAKKSLAVQARLDSVKKRKLRGACTDECVSSSEESIVHLGTEYSYSTHTQYVSTSTSYTGELLYRIHNYLISLNSARDACLLCAVLCDCAGSFSLLPPSLARRHVRPMGARRAHYIHTPMRRFRTMRTRGSQLDRH